MKKVMLTSLLLASSLTFCGDPALLEPNTEREVVRIDSTHSEQDTSYTDPDTTGNDSTYTPPDTTEVPVNRNDLIMFMELRRMELNQVMEYTGKIQTVGDTVWVNNLENTAIMYTAFKDGEIFAQREEESKIKFGLYEHGYFQNTTDDTLVHVEVSNVVLTYISGGDTLQTKVPFPIKITRTLPRNKFYESERIKQPGLYNFEVGIDYTVSETMYHVNFISESVNVGSLGKRKYPIKLEMRRK